MPYRLKELRTSIWSTRPRPLAIRQPILRLSLSPLVTATGDAEATTRGNRLGRALSRSDRAPDALGGAKHLLRQRPRSATRRIEHPVGPLLPSAAKGVPPR